MREMVPGRFSGWRQPHNASHNSLPCRPLGSGALGSQHSVHTIFSSLVFRLLGILVAGQFIHTGGGSKGLRSLEASQEEAPQDRGVCEDGPPGSKGPWAGVVGLGTTHLPPLAPPEREKCSDRTILLNASLHLWAFCSAPEREEYRDHPSSAFPPFRSAPAPTGLALMIFAPKTRPLIEQGTQAWPGSWSGAILHSAAGFALSLPA